MIESTGLGISEKGEQSESISLNDLIVIRMKMLLLLKFDSTDLGINGNVESETISLNDLIVIRMKMLLLKFDSTDLGINGNVESETISLVILSQ